MQTASDTYSCAIIGGGLAGLCLAIQLANKGVPVILFEKNTYPFHKVCGEYISMESWDFLSNLGIPLADLVLPRITELGISSENGFMMHATLPLGGFGISRHSLDFYLCTLAKQKGVHVLEDCTVRDVEKVDAHNIFINTSKGNYKASIVCGSYGKYTPAFAKDKKTTRQHTPNYIGVKYHIKTDLAPNRIELHNFTGGYCGVSKIDKDAYCLCYLTTSDQLKQSGNDLRKMEQTFLYQNPFLKKYFTESEFLFDQPLTISNISFHKKESHTNNLFLLGDAAGSITPLCGNGMSMAMRASKLLADLLLLYYNARIAKPVLIQRYEQVWNQHFNTRIRTGYYLQYLFGKRQTTSLALKLLDKMPALTQKLIGLTHGDSF